MLIDLDLTVTHGSITALLGPSGSGKTTLLRLVAGFDQVDHGRIRIGDAVVDDGHRRQPPERRHLGYVPQDGALFPHLTVAANVGFGLSRAHRHSPKVGELLEMVGLAGLERRYPDQLSGGQQQRVALAHGQPTTRSRSRRSTPPYIRADVQQLLKESGTTSVLVTHDQDEALSAADRVAVLRDGAIAQCDAPQELYSRPVVADMARFIGEANLIPGILNGSSVQTLLGVLAVTGTDSRRGRVAAGAARNGGDGARAPVAMVLIRPEQVELVPGVLGVGPAVSAETGPAGPPEHRPDRADHRLRVSRPRRGGHGAAGAGPAGPPVTVRTLGGQALSTGSRVTLARHGPVIAWPQRGG